MVINRLTGFLWTICVVASIPADALAQSGKAKGASYPSKPIRLLVPLAAGGPTDVLTRLIAQPLSDRLGQPIVVDNRPGASGNIASELAAKAPADGHTLFIAGAGSLAINVSLFNKLPYDPVRDFTPIILVASAPFIVALHPAVPASSIKELIALAKAKPGQLSYGTPGSGSTSHLATELFATSAGVRFLHIPYKGAVLATTDLISGQIQLSFASTPGSMPYVKSAQLKALGVTSAKRLARLPALPTVSEFLPGYEATVWYGFVAPAGTPREVVQRLNTEIAGIVQDPLHRERLLANDYEPTTTSPEQFGAFIKSEIAKWAHAVKISGARAD